MKHLFRGIVFALEAGMVLVGCRSTSENSRIVEGAPLVVAAYGHVGSDACRACHPGQHASYRNTYHSTMTRLPKDVSFDGTNGPTLPVELSDDMRVYRLEKRGGEITVDGPDLHFVGAAFEKLRGHEEENEARVLALAPKVKRPLALVTGSHHYLAFWVSGGERKELRQLPFVWLTDERRFLPRAAAFLAKPGETLQVPNWNASCIQCHTTAFEPRESEGTDPSPWVHYDSRVTDLSIACESCHGPAKAHVEHYRSPFVRATSRLSKSAPYAILAPNELEATRSSALCGQCHSYFVPVKSDEWWNSGFTKSPPAHRDLGASRELLSADHPERAKELGLSRDLASIFWSDGSVRVGGREYHGLLRSPCYEKGLGSRKLACVSCHEMHGGTKDSALAPDRPLETTCRSCHEQELSEKWHRGHPGAASCADCHMPKTSYALLGTVMSHEIKIPRASIDPPSACIPCHLDRNESWLRGALGETKIETPLGEIPFGPRLTLTGDAGFRAIVGDWLGEPSATKSLAPELRAALLEELLRDEYPAVREIARRSGAEASPSPRSSAEFSRLRALRDERSVVISE